MAEYIEVDLHCRWHLKYEHGDSQEIRYCDSIAIASAIIVLVQSRGMKCRVLVTKNRVDEMQWYRFRVFLLDFATHSGPGRHYQGNNV
jgi:hypothetical protein